MNQQAVRQCEFQWVPVTQPGSRLPDWKRCHRAVLAPASFCHEHGGNIETSLGLPYPTAVTAAQHNQLTLPDPDLWHTLTSRMERTQGRGWLLFVSHPVGWARMWVNTTGEHLRVGDRVAALSHYLASGIDQGLEGPTLESFVATSLHQPHLPPRRWQELAREVVDDHAGVVSSRKVPVQAVEFAPEWSSQQAWGYMAMNTPGMSVPVEMVGFNKTEGGPVDTRAFRTVTRTIQPQSGHSTETALDLFGAVASSRGWRLMFGIHQPDDGVAYFERDGRVASVYGRIGDQMTRLHAVAHTAGHIALGHTTCGDARRAPQEADAEVWAFLALARIGMLQPAAAEAWRATFNVDLRVGSYFGLRAAAAALDWTIH